MWGGSDPSTFSCSAPVQGRFASGRLLGRRAGFAFAAGLSWCTHIQFPDRRSQTSLGLSRYMVINVPSVPGSACLSLTSSLIRWITMSNARVYGSNFRQPIFSRVSDDSNAIIRERSMVWPTVPSSMSRSIDLSQKAKMGKASVQRGDEARSELATYPVVGAYAFFVMVQYKMFRLAPNQTSMSTEEASVLALAINRISASERCKSSQFM